MLTDTFTRTATAGLGSTDGGLPWVIDQGTNTQFAVDGSEAKITAVAGKAPIAHVGPNLADGYVQFRTRATAVPTGGQQNMLAALRLTDPTNYWRAGLQVAAGGNMTCYVQRQVANANTAIGSTVNLGTYVANTWYWIYFEIVGVHCKLFVWKDGTTKPTTPTIEGDDVPLATSGATASGFVGFRNQTVAGNTNLPTWEIDDLTSDVVGTTAAPTTAPPTTSVIGGTPAPTTRNPLLHYEYRVDGGPWSSTSQPTIELQNLSAGDHLFEVRAWDGTQYSPVQSYAWSVAETEVSIDTGGWQPSIPPLELDSLGVGQHIFQVRGVYPDGSRSPISSYTWTIGSPTTTPQGRKAIAGSSKVAWKMILCDRNGNTLGPIDEFQNGTWIVNHNGVDSLQFDIFIDDNIADRFVELETYVKLWRSMEGWDADPSFPDFAGVVGPINDQGQARISTIVCYSPFYVLNQRLVFEVLKYGMPIKTTDVVDQGEICWNLIQYTNSRRDTNIVRGLIEPTVGRRMQYDRAQNIWSAIQDMTTVLGGLDIWPTYVHTEGSPVLCRFNCGYVNGIYNPNARIDYFDGTQNCTDMQQQSATDPGNIATYVEEDGQGSGTSAVVPTAFSADYPTIESGIGLWEEIDSQDNVSDTVLLQAYSDEQLKQKKEVPKTLTPVVSPVLPPWYRRHYSVGDVLPATSKRGRMKFQDYLRVFAAQMVLAPSGEETTTLTLAKDIQGVVQGVPDS